jgi:hypothetical protein
VPDLEDLAERLRQLALSLPEAYEDDPWGHPVFKVAENSMFASMSVGRYGWVTAEVADEESLESALEWLRESYWLKAPPHLRAAVEGE